MSEDSDFEAPERLFHYTSGYGLFGILSGKCLWATHYSFLNDRKEIHAAKDSLEAFVAKRLLTTAARYKINKEVSFSPGIRLREIVPEESSRYIDILYESALLVGIPFVTSFFVCDQNLDPKTFQNGSIRHWQTYGRDGGYALQLSPDILKKKIMEEYSASDPSVISMFLTKVFYPEDSECPEFLCSEYEAVCKICELMMEQSLNRTVPDNTYDETANDSFGPIMRIMSSIKDSCFSDEREARVVTFRPSAENAAKGGEGRPPEVHIRTSPAIDVPFIKTLQNKLLEPQVIERIIIGPHPENLLRRQALELFLESNSLEIDISVSEVPYVTRR